MSTSTTATTTTTQEGRSMVNMWSSSSTNTFVGYNGTVTNIGTQAIGTIVRDSAPFYIVGDNGGTLTEWQSTAMAGTVFVHSPYRNGPQMYRMYALEAATVSVYKNGVLEATQNVAAYSYETITGAYTSYVMSFNSTGSILLASWCTDSADYNPIPPASQTIYGSCSTLSAVYAYDYGETVSVTQSCSDGTTATLSAGSRATISTFGSQYTGKACKWTAPAGKLIGGATVGDGDGGDSTTFLPLTLFQQVTPLPKTLEYLFLISDQAATCSTASGTTYSLTGSATNGVYKYYTSSNIAAGTVLSCDAPITALGDDTSTNEEYQIILGPVWAYGISTTTTVTTTTTSTITTTTTSTTSAVSVSYSFLFGGESVSSVPGAILDTGHSYGDYKTSQGYTYGWLCDGSPMSSSQETSQISGVRAPPRSTYGLNHFDRENVCKSGSTYLPVTWKLDVPAGSYQVSVLFPESYKSQCSVMGTNAGCGSSSCTYSSTVTVGNDGFYIGGFGHDSGLCHSVGLVIISGEELDADFNGTGPVAPALQIALI
eukprot:TRINITY_DN255_c0_g1_i18.p1 TRINITY_DN255_c0_g1~~TRINITY_DN255_c0_g1_i18.p1  ORF type:complete len:542 (+),score=47.93 TRINITY_DN255_c0_g1_i18:1886-3511(+)